jgi:phage-related minor tail protein
MNAWRAPDTMAAWREREGSFAANTEEQNKQILKDREEWFKKIADAAKKAEEEVKKLHEEVKKLEDEFAESKVFSGEGSNYERMEAMLRSGSQLSGIEERRAESLYGKGTDWAEADKLWAAYLDRVQESTRATEIFNDTMDIMAQSSANAFAEFVTGTKSAKDAFQSMVQSMIAGLARLASQKFVEQIFGSIGQGAAGFFGGGSSGWQPAFDPVVGPMVAKGAAFGPAGMIEFARGGIVSGPTVFPFARGVGLMGEAGPEAVMPLARNSRGELGVKGGGGAGGIEVVVNNYTGQQVETKETRGPGGMRQLEIMIGQALVKDGPASRAMQSTYGLSRKGAMRG